MIYNKGDKNIKIRRDLQIKEERDQRYECFEVNKLISGNV